MFKDGTWGSGRRQRCQKGRRMWVFGCWRGQECQKHPKHSNEMVHTAATHFTRSSRTRALHHSTLTMIPSLYLPRCVYHVRSRRLSPSRHTSAVPHCRVSCHSHLHGENNTHISLIAFVSCTLTVQSPFTRCYHRSGNVSHAVSYPLLIQPSPSLASSISAPLIPLDPFTASLASSSCA